MVPEERKHCPKKQVHPNLMARDTMVANASTLSWVAFLCHHPDNDSWWLVCLAQFLPCQQNNLQATTLKLDNDKEFFHIYDSGERPRKYFRHGK
jgi:hypothetical protein